MPFWAESYPNLHSTTLHPLPTPAALVVEKDASRHCTASGIEYIGRARYQDIAIAIAIEILAQFC
jgi:hypothetical protein